MAEGEETPATQGEETLSTEAAEDEENGGSSVEGEEPEEGLDRANQLFEKGSKALEEDDFVEAVDCLSRALEIRYIEEEIASRISES